MGALFIIRIFDAVRTSLIVNGPWDLLVLLFPPGEPGGYVCGTGPIAVRSVETVCATSVMLVCAALGSDVAAKNVADNKTCRRFIPAFSPRSP